MYIIPGGKKQPGCTPSEFRKNLLKSQLRSQGCLLFLEEEKTGVSFVPGQYCASANCVLYSWKILIVPNFQFLDSTWYIRVPPLQEGTSSVIILKCQQPRSPDITSQFYCPHSNHVKCRGGWWWCMVMYDRVWQETYFNSRDENKNFFLSISCSKQKREYLFFNLGFQNKNQNHNWNNPRENFRELHSLLVY